MAETTVTKNKKGYGYEYASLSAVHEHLAEINASYYQYVETDTFGNDYIITVPIINGKELAPRRGCKVVNAPLSGSKNPAQEQGSALTYARRYSVLMAFGLATEDDDAQSLTQKPQNTERRYQPSPKVRTRAELESQLYAICNTEALTKYLEKFRVGNVSDLSDDQIKRIIEAKKNGLRTKEE